MTDPVYPAWALDNPLRRAFHPPRQAVDRLAPRPGDAVTDLGAGVGYHDEEILARVGPSGHLTLVDIHRPNLERFRRRHGPDPRVTVSVSSAARVPEVPTGSQDRVLIADVLCDVEDKAGVLDEAWRMLRDGGVVYASFHSTPVPIPSRPYWVTPEVWARLIDRHPWQLEGSGQGRQRQWHRLRKPSTGAGPAKPA